MASNLSEVLSAKAPHERTALALSEALLATTTNRAGITEPDHRTRLQAAMAILAYQVGKPVERQEVITVNLDTDQNGDLKQRVANSPALQAAMQKLLDHAASQKALDA